jgi:hypothetical protein
MDIDTTKKINDAKEKRIKAKVLSWMRAHEEEYETATQLAEGAAAEFDGDEWCDDSDHWVWDLALEAKPTE